MIGYLIMIGISIEWILFLCFGLDIGNKDNQETDADKNKKANIETNINDLKKAIEFNDAMIEKSSNPDDIKKYIDERFNQKIELKKLEKQHQELNKVGNVS